MSTLNEKLSSREKALRINLQPSIYGVFAEIGAGQEVSNHFYKAGAASGTIAKSICAYDMMVSDTIYGRAKRYVSKERLQNMLDVEYRSLVSSVPSKASMAHFFVFANTIETINYHKTNKGQGWLGIKFQTSPNGPPSHCLIHVVLHTDDIHKQQQLIGHLGVNLIYGIYEHQNDPEQFIESLKDNIDPNQLEVNFITVSGNDVSANSSKVLSLLLVKYNLTKMVMIGKNGEIVQPLNALYNKDVVLVRGRFNPPTKVTQEMFEQAKQQLIERHNKQKQDLLAVAELTFRCYHQDKELDLDDFINRTELITKMGYCVLITNFKYHHAFITFINDFVKLNSLNLVLGLDNLERSLQPGNLAVNEKESLKLIQSMISKENRILVFPELGQNGELKSYASVNFQKGVHALIDFLATTNRIEDITNVDTRLLFIRSDDVLENVQNNGHHWQNMVPEELVPLMRTRQLNMRSQVSNTK